MFFIQYEPFPAERAYVGPVYRDVRAADSVAAYAGRQNVNAMAQGEKKTGACGFPTILAAEEDALLMRVGTA